MGILELAGVTDMEDRDAEITPKAVVPEEVALEKLLGMVEVAVMVTTPGEMAVARPLLLIVATDGMDELQVTSEVISRVVWSLKKPVAVNFWVAPTVTCGLDGVTTMPLSFTVPAHVARDAAKDPRNNMVKQDLIFFMRTPCRFPIEIYTRWQNLSIVVAFRILLGWIGKLSAPRNRQIFIEEST